MFQKGTGVSFNPPAIKIMLMQSYCHSKQHTYPLFEVQSLTLWLKQLTFLPMFVQTRCRHERLLLSSHVRPEDYSHLNDFWRQLLYFLSIPLWTRHLNINDNITSRFFNLDTSNILMGMIYELPNTSYLSGNLEVRYLVHLPAVYFVFGLQMFQNLSSWPHRDWVFHPWSTLEPYRKYKQYLL